MKYDYRCGDFYFRYRGRPAVVRWTRKSRGRSSDHVWHGSIQWDGREIGTAQKTQTPSFTTSVKAMQLAWKKQHENTQPEA